ncbi:MAG TPA: dual specificity protein phosphatase family protein, partial [Candidatus Polarisedimenticolaceae bacterium]|nr:dual specificity protein phosphatase family protein [Candidatus Polarisedimenticolaceae bacterium]
LRHFGVALANEAPFILDLHFGVWAKSIQSTDRRSKRLFGKLAYVMAAIKQFSSATRYSYHLQLDGKKLHMDGYACLVANEGFHSVLGVPLFLHPNTRGLLQVAIIKRANQLALLRWFLLRSLGIHDSSVVAIRRVKEVVIDKAPSQMFFDDESVMAELPLAIKPSAYAIPAIAAPVSNSSFWRQLSLRTRIEPYRIYDHLRRIITGAPYLKSSQIAPNLYVGGQYSPWAVGKLRGWGVTGVVNMRNVHRPSRSSELEILNLPTPDHHAPTLKALQQGVEFIQRHIDNGGGVYVHCQLGEGRAPTMAAAYLISQGMRPRDAVAHIERFRRLVRPNAQQLRQLARFEAELASERSA